MASYKKLVANGYSRDIRSVAEIINVPLTDPRPDEVLLKNHFGGVNASDLNISGGVYFSDGIFPFDLGCESIGEVIAVGEGVADFEVGDYAISPNLGSAFSEYLCRESEEFYKVPICTPGVMSLINAGVTASIGLDVVGEMGSDETVLVTAAAGSVGSWVVQLAKHAGNHVIGTCSTAEKGEQLKRLGCDRVVLYKDEDLGSVLSEEYPDGVDLVFEQVGQGTFDACVDNIAQKGRILICGFVSEYKSGPQEITSPRIYHKLLWKSASLRAFLFIDWPDHVPNHMDRNLQLIIDGIVDPLVDQTEFIGVEDAVEAVEFLHSGKNIGKVVLKY